MNETVSGTELFFIALVLLVVLVLNGEVGIVTGAIGNLIGLMGKAAGAIIDIYSALQ